MGAHAAHRAIDVRLRRLTLQGDETAVASARASLPGALATAPWPATADDEIIVVRCVQVHGHPAELAARAAATVRELVGDAADPWESAADAADAVRFRNALDYRSCLIRDLLAGTARRRWLWRHRADLLARPPATALGELLGEDALTLPALLAHPALHRALPALWRTLDASAGRQVLQAIGTATGWGGGIACALEANADRARDRLDERNSATAGFATPPRAPATSCSDLPADLPPTDPRIVLQAVLSLWAQTPVTLARGDAGQHLRATARALLRAAPTPARSHRATSGPQYAAATNAAAAQRAVGDAPRSVPSTPRMPTFPVRTTDPLSSSTAASAASLPPAAEHDFYSRGGGFFFLLNALNLPTLRDWRAALDETQAGWRELVRLAHVFGFIPDPSLACFLATACNLTDGTEPVAALADLGPGHAPDVVRHAALRHHGEAALRAALAERPARILATRSQVNVHLRLADADLGIRRTGLDLDPGWLPWLGRVVRFHYDSGGFTP